MKIFRKTFLLALIITSTGCAYLTDIYAKIKTRQEPQPQEIVVDRWLGQNFQNATPTLKLSNAYIEDNKIYVTYEKYNWPAPDGLDAIACFFYRDSSGSLVGGKFDWIRKGGQGVKTLTNISEGYGGHSMPAKGAECYYMWASVDGRERSNFAEVEWK